MSVVADDICLEVQSPVSGPPFSQTYPEAASQTFKRGWLVALNGSGFVVDPASDTPALILGIAAQDAHNDSVAGTSQISVYLANETNIFAMNCKQSGLADHVLTQADIGRPMAIQRDTVNNRLFLNASTFVGANVRVTTLGLGQSQPSTPATGSGPFGVGDTNVRLTCLFRPANFQIGGTS